MDRLYKELSPEEEIVQKKEIQGYVERFEKLETERKILATHWQECMEVIIPRKEDVISIRQPGDKRNDQLFDTTAIYANILLASSLHGMLTNPATKFFELIMGDPLLDDDEQVIKWLQEVADKMYVVLNNSNFQTEIHEIYIDLGAIGTSCLYMGEHPERVIHFNARGMKEIYVEENNLGLIDTVARKFEWKAKQIVQEFGEDKVHPSVVSAYHNNSDTKYVVHHWVHPKDPAAQNTEIHDFKSIYYLANEKILLSKGGFREFPYAVPRWTKTTGEVYGRGPGMEMLPDIKMVNKMMETVLKGAQKQVDPPMAVEDDNVIGRVRLTPGGLTIVRPGSEPIKPLIPGGTNVDFGVKMVEDVRNRIRSGFFVDQLQLNQGPQMTATEVSQRTEENMRFMGPVLGRQHFELLRPMIERLFGIMMRKGMFTDAPASIKGKNFDVRYSSLIARAQRSSESQTLGRAMQIAAPIIQANPSSMDVIDPDKTVKYIMEINGVPEKLLRDQKQVAMIRDSREKQAQAQQKAAIEQHQAEVAQKTLPGAAQVMQAQAMSGQKNGAMNR